MEQIKRRSTTFTKGFTLLEVVIAMAILGMGMTVIMELFSGGLRLGRTSEEYTKAANYAHVKLEEIRSQEKISEGVEEGELEGAFRWQVSVKRIELLPTEKNPDFKPPVELFQVKVSILWKSGSKERSTSIESYKVNKSEGDEKKS